MANGRGKLPPLPPAFTVPGVLETLRQELGAAKWEVLLMETRLRLVKLTIGGAIAQVEILEAVTKRTPANGAGAVRRHR
jgi:hypothetical protein